MPKRIASRQPARKPGRPLRKKMSLDLFAGRMGVLAQDCTSTRPITDVLRGYSRLERAAIRSGVASRSELAIRRWIAQDAAIVAQLRREQPEVTIPLVMRALALGFTSRFEKFVAVALFSHYCRDVGLPEVGEHLLRAALWDAESDPRSKTTWRANLDGMLPPVLKRGRRYGVSSDHQAPWTRMFGGKDDD